MTYHLDMPPRFPTPPPPPPPPWQLILGMTFVLIVSMTVMLLSPRVYARKYFRDRK